VTDERAPVEAAVEAPEAAGPAPAAGPAAKPSRARLVLLAALFVGLFVIGYLLDVTAYLTQERIEGMVEAAGPWGFVVFAALFSLGELAHVPGIVFIVVGSILWGPWAGGAISYASALASVSVAFAIVRRVGGQPLASMQRPWMRLAMLRLETRPVTTVAILRLVFFMLPALNYVLALTPVRYRDFLIGSAIGLVPGVILVSSGVSGLASWLGWG
jgi:uncharacterized membrane protein YdjX (TVP38/TMEM64 family)